MWSSKTKSSLATVSWPSGSRFRKTYQTKVGTKQETTGVCSSWIRAGFATRVTRPCSSTSMSPFQETTPTTPILGTISSRTLLATRVTSTRTLRIFRQSARRKRMKPVTTILRSCATPKQQKRTAASLFLAWVTPTIAWTQRTPLRSAFANRRATTA